MTALLDPHDRGKITVHYAAVAAPHASPPTEDAALQVWRIQRGRKLTRRTAHGANGLHRLLVPSYESWMGDTLRAVLWRLAALVPAAPAWTREKGFALGGADVALMTGRFEVKANRFRIAAESHDAGVSIALAPWKFSDPMQSWIASLPPTPFPVTAIANPGYIDVPSVDEDLNEAADSGDRCASRAADVKDIYRRLRRLSTVERQALDEITRLMEKRDEDDDDE